MLLKFQVESGGICATLLKRARSLAQRVELSLCHLFNTVTNGIEVDGGFILKKIETYIQILKNEDKSIIRFQNCPLIKRCRVPDTQATVPLSIVSLTKRLARETGGSAARIILVLVPSPFPRTLMRPALACMHYARRINDVLLLAT
jgi:hypothetical protein